MKTYRVWAKSISYCFVEIEAESENDAMEIAEEMDGGDFEDSGVGDWIIDDVIEV